ncbi:MAG TPA: beta-ketoacyl synthase N-terminal-like domain-containing protein [Tepidisphaeraceae bacterium]|jgi:3-oxoacyl-[acyl-carrier-protein] synthase II
MSRCGIITGAGLITPLGSSVEQTWSSLLAGQFIRDHARVPLQSARQSRVHRLGLTAAREAIAQAGWSDFELSDPRTALTIGTSKGPVESWLNGDPIGSIHDFGLSELSAGLARELGHGAGPRSTLSAACASGIHALIHAVLLIRSGAADRALVVAAEASVHPMFIGSFKRLGVLPAEGVGCRPFDHDRDGFLISEAAAAVCIESSETSRGIAVIDRFALGGDAVHLTGGDPQGRTLKYLLGHVVDGRPVDLIHAHATGTLFHDPIELRAIESTVFQTDPRPIVYSHKGALGHSLGAAGLVAVVLNCQSHRTGIIPGNVQTRRALPTDHVAIASDPTARPVRRSVALAAGFGGAMGAVSLVS